MVIYLAQDYPFFLPGFLLQKAIHTHVSFKLLLN